MSYGNPRTLSRLSDLIPHMSGRLIGCPPALMKLTLYNTARSFCRDTGALREVVGPISFVEGEQSYKIELPYLASVLAVHKLYIHNVEQHPSSYKVTCDQDGQYSITFPSASASDDTDAMTIDVSMTPYDGCDEYPLEFLQQYGDGIVAGALYELMLDQTKRWGNPAMVSHFYQIFQKSKQDAGFKRLSAASIDGRLSFQNDEHFAGSFQ